MPKRALSQGGRTLPPIRGWEAMREMCERILKERTGADLKAWISRIEREHLKDKEALRAWLDEQRVTGYARMLLEMERFGYPDFLTTSADELVDAQYSKRPHLRPIFNALVAAAVSFGEVIVQARKTYVSLVSPRRTFARIQASSKDHVDLALRLTGLKARGRLQPSRIHETMPLQIRFASPSEIDEEALRWLKRAYDANC